MREVAILLITVLLSYAAGTLVVTILRIADTLDNIEKHLRNKE